MARHLYKATNLVIPANGRNSGAFTVPSALGNLIGMVVFTPANLLETVTMQVAPLANPAEGDWKTLQIIPGVDATFAAGKAVSVRATGFFAVLLHSEPQAAVDRSFAMVAQLDTSD